ncbi:hypothetical protein [Streptomyces violascens]|uniref:hypothetical protein n=1 Tax=Streptomyces violascens TaxID=67381 RepID=UPI001676CF3D|nr:hypothetical protein [Streptomyces violascens]
MRVTQEQHAERRPGTPAGGAARRESALARIHRTAGDAAVAQLFAPAAERGRGQASIQLQKDFEDHTCRSWFFRVYGGGPGESFHEQQAASGFFNNPMTLRVGRPPAGPDTAAR